MGKTARPGFYAVRKGRSVGVFKTWDECKASVDSYSGARYKKFDTSSEAWDFVNSADTSKSLSGGGSSFGGSSGYNSASSQKSKAGASSSTYSAPKRQGSDYAAPSKKKCTAKEQNDRVSVYTGHACSYNGKKAGAGCGVYWGHRHKDNLSQRLKGRQTNQRAEINACTLALETARNKRIPKVTLHTDSQYTINCMTMWIKKWKRNGWKTNEEKDVCNKKDLMKLDELCQEVDVQWVHVPEDSNVKGNEATDKLAVKGAAMPYLYRTKRSRKQDYDDFYDDDSDEDYYY